MISLIPCGEVANESESKAIAQLKNRLDSEVTGDDWLLYTNLSFSATRHRQSDEIDIVVIGPPGVQIIEVKHWTAAWVNRNREIVEREAERLTDKARRIGTTLRRRFPALPQVDGVFFVTEVASKVGMLNDDKVRGIPFYTSKTWKRAVGFHSQPVLSSQEIKMLGAILEPMSAVSIDGALKRVADYTRLQLQTPKEQRFHRVYKATHISRQDKVILHLYDLSALSPKDSRAEDKAEREWKSLRLLQRYDWAPRIVDSFQDAPGYPGEIKFFTVADPATPSIEKRSLDDSWDTTARLIFARNAIRALIDLHGAGSNDKPMVHRNLSSNTILVKHDNSPILTSFEYTRIPADISVVSSANTTDWDVSVSPEVRAQGLVVADHQSDVYSLCASLAVLFEDLEDKDSVLAKKILNLGMDNDPDRRSGLSDLDKKLSVLLKDPLPEPPPPPARFWTEDQIVPFRTNHYRIILSLGSGGVGMAFKVVQVDRENQDEYGTFVAKVVHDEETGRRVLNAYKLARSHLRHTTLSTIFEVAEQWKENGFVALMTWIEGEPLGEYSGILSLLADDVQEVSDDRELALTWLRTACKALKILHENGLVHGDVSPSNMIVSGSDLVLTDYDCVTKIGAQADAIGTALYCSPSISEGCAVVPSDDIYALAASFFHVLFDREPFQYDGVYSKKQGLNWGKIKRENYPLLGEFLDQATHPDPRKRLATADAALAILGPSQDVESESENATLGGVDSIADGVESALPTGVSERRENEVEWLKSLLQSYPGSLWGNSETRGLDTEFAKKTYVETNLEQELYTAIKDRGVKLVVLCGNAGDGKTALLQRLAKQFGLDIEDSATRIFEGRLNGGSTAVRMNLDGSASWKGSSADDLLDEFLEPFQTGEPSDDIVHLLAINDGRLLEWVEKHQEETLLTKSLSDFLEKEKLLDIPHIRFVNLNQRSLVGGIADDKKTIDTNFLDRLVDSLYGGENSAEIWAPCQTCQAQERCEVFRATSRFGPTGLSDDSIRGHARRQLFEALQAVHLRGETHITIRELRAALIYILFGLHYCTDYHATEYVSDNLQSYWDRAFSPKSIGRQGEVLSELPRFDPALEAHPKIDRQLLHPRPYDGSEGVLADGNKNLESLRRRAYFERTKKEIKCWTGESNALGLAQGKYFSQFRDLPTIDDDQKLELIRKLCGGISRLGVLPRQALERSGMVPLRITPRTPTETVFWIEKPMNNFRLEEGICELRNGIDQLHRQVFLIYKYRDGNEEKLRLGADLFHLLLEISDGHQLGDVATDDSFAHLSIFVQRLVQEDHRRILTWNPMLEDTIFEVSARIDDTDSSVSQLMEIKSLGETNGD